MNVTRAYGFDVVYAIDPACYVITEDATGRSYALEMDDETREAVTAATREAIRQLDTRRLGPLHPSDVAQLDIQPGYIRLQAEPSGRRGISPATFSALRAAIASAYNDHHATDPDVEGLRLTDYYLTTYQPEDAPDAKTVRERYESDDAPDSDEPIFEVDRPVPEYAGTDSAYLAYRVTIPFARDAYVLGKGQSHPFKWDDHTRGRFTSVVDDRPRWPSYTTTVDSHPQYVVVDVHGAALRPPAEVADKVRDALMSYNNRRGIHPGLSSAGTDRLGPEIDFAEAAYIEGLEVDGAGVEEWIGANGLDEVDGEPREPPTETDAPDSSGWQKLNPFGD